MSKTDNNKSLDPIKRKAILNHFANKLTHDDLLVILSRAMIIDDNEDEEIAERVRERCRRFNKAIPEIVEKLNLRRSHI